MRGLLIILLAALLCDVRGQDATNRVSLQITQPFNGWTYSTFAHIRIRVDVNDPDRQVRNVLFLVFDTTVATAINAPYEYVFYATSNHYYFEGSYYSGIIFKAVAACNGGIMVTSRPVSVGISGTIVFSPYVIFVKPKNNQTFYENEPIALATITNPMDGSEEPLTYVINGTGRVTVPFPYDIALTNLTSGRHVITAEAYDINGNRGTSAPVVVNVGKTIVRFVAGDGANGFTFDALGAIAGKTNEVQVSADLLRWNTFTNFQTSSNRFRITDAESPIEGRRFYRVLSR